MDGSLLQSRFVPIWAAFFSGAGPSFCVHSETSFSACIYRILGHRLPSRLLKNAVHFGYKLRGVRKERARQTGRVLDRDPSAAQIERRPILPAGERSSGHNWFWERSAPAVPASL